jgi:flagellar hook-associated protein FlgK
LVVGNQSYQLKAVQAPDDVERTTVAIVGVGGTALTLPESQVTGGSLGGLLNFRSQTLDGTQNSLGRIALTLVQNFNDQHRLGQDLTGALGQSLFSISAPTVWPSSLNAGTGTAGSVTATSGTLLFGTPAGPAVDGINASATTGVLDFSTVSAQVDANVVVGGGGMSAFDYSGAGLGQFDVNFAGSAVPVGITLIADYGSGAGLATEIQNQIRATAGNGAVTVGFAGGNITITNTGKTGALNAVAISSVDVNAAIATHDFDVSVASNGSAATPATATFTVGNGVDTASITLNGVYADQDAVAAAVTAQLAASGNTTSTITATNNLGVITLNNVGSPNAVSITASNQAAIDAGFVSDAGTAGNGAIATTNANLTIDGQAVLLNADYASYTAMAAAIGTALGAGYTVAAAAGGFTVARTTTGPASTAINITGGDLRSDLAGITTAGTRAGIAGAAPSAIAGTGAPAVSIDAATIDRLTSSDYRLTFVGGATPYQLTRLADNRIQSFASLPQTVDGMTIAVGTWTGAGAPAVNDSVLIQPTRSGAGSIAVAFSDPRQIAAGAPIRTVRAMSNTGTAAISAGTVNAPPPTHANLQNPVTLAFTSPTTFTVSGATPPVVGAVAYSAGGDITYNGWTTQITGNPATGDRFTIEANTSGVADNRNAALLGALQTRSTMIGNSTSGPSASYQSAYTQIVSAVGSKANEVAAIGDAQQGLADHATQALQSLSGVNLDEEAANLLRYQQAYQASAKVLQIAGKVFDEILALGR